MIIKSFYFFFFRESLVLEKYRDGSFKFFSESMFDEENEADTLENMLNCFFFFMSMFFLVVW